MPSTCDHNYESFKELRTIPGNNFDIESCFVVRICKECKDRDESLLWSNHVEH